MANPPAQDRPDDAWTIGRLLAWTQQHFEAKEVDAPRLAAELLLAKAMGWRRIDLYARFEAEPTAEQRADFRQMVLAAAAHKPIAYLIGQKEFYSLEFKVTTDVLIPRPETELLVERALAWCKEHDRQRYDVLDLGTGSGCIAIAFAKRQPSAQVVASDVSQDALAVADDNARRHEVADRVRCVRADMLDLPPDVLPDGGFDIIVANPPYVADAERDTLPACVRDYEPELALFHGGDGLDAYRRIAKDLRSSLKPGGTLILEVGHQQASAVEEIMTGSGGLQREGRFRDLGGIERVIQLTLSP